jgi:hypothetical protein
MNMTGCRALTALSLLSTATIWTGAAVAQTAQAKEKPPMYTYVSNWTIPRARWADMEKQGATDTKVFDKAMSSGQLVAYGSDETLVHHADGDTHDSFWSAMSMAGVLGVLDELHKGGATAVPVLSSATKHNDKIYVTHYYNWKSGAIKDGYTHGASYRLKADAPDDALDTLSKTLIVPLLEKLLADGTIQEYEIDEEAIHTESPGAFSIFYITQNAAGVDKVTAALGEALKANALAGPAFGSMVDFSEHRDELLRTNASFK